MFLQFKSYQLIKENIGVQTYHRSPPIARYLHYYSHATARCVLYTLYILNIVLYIKRGIENVFRQEKNDINLRPFTTLHRADHFFFICLLTL